MELFISQIWFFKAHNYLKGFQKGLKIQLNTPLFFFNVRSRLSNVLHKQLHNCDSVGYDDTGPTGFDQRNRLLVKWLSMPQTSVLLAGYRMRQSSPPHLQP